MMAKKFGTFNPVKAEGMLRPIRFPSLCTLGEMTPDGRWLDPDTAGTRDLPRTIFCQFAQEPGHWASRPVGVLQEVEFEEDGNSAGRGWLIDTDDGRMAALFVATEAQRHNSIDITEARVEWDWDDEIDDIVFKFFDWKIGATTLVGKPAFPNARAELDEITAALMESDSELTCEFDSFEINFVDEEITASAVLEDDATIVSWDAFHRPEADRYTKIVVTKEREVYGHLGCWNQPHMGINGRLVTIPRVRDNYASFNKAGPLTEQGQVETGPIFFLGGHPDNPLQPGQTHKAYGGVENGWADVRIIDGRFGPWISGIVRPGMSDEAVYVARASRISGHWKHDRLQAIVSCNVEGFNVPGSGLSADRNGAVFADGKVLELVASFDAPGEEEVVPETGINVHFDATEALGQAFRDLFTPNINGVAEAMIEAAGDETTEAVEVTEAEADAILVELGLEDVD